MTLEAGPIGAALGTIDQSYQVAQPAMGGVLRDEAVRVRVHSEFWIGERRRGGTDDAPEPSVARRSANDDLAPDLQTEYPIGTLVVEPDHQIVQWKHRGLLDRDAGYDAGLPSRALLAKQGGQVVRHDRVLIGVTRAAGQFRRHGVRFGHLREPPPRLDPACFVAETPACADHTVPLATDSKSPSLGRSLWARLSCTAPSLGGAESRPSTPSREQ